MAYKKLAAWLAVILVIAAVGVWYETQQMDEGLCANTVVQAVTSPDGQLKAVVFEREARILQIQYPARTRVFHQAAATEVSLGLFRKTAVTIRYTKAAKPLVRL